MARIHWTGIPAAAWLAQKTVKGTARAGAGIAGGAGRFMTNEGNMPLIAAGAITAGAGAALMDRDGPWRGDIFPRAQEAITGDPNAIQNVAMGALSTAATGDMGTTNEFGLEETGVPSSYYYGRPVNRNYYGNHEGFTARGRHGNPVSGDVVFGMYNLRR